MGLKVLQDEAEAAGASYAELPANAAQVWCALCGAGFSLILHLHALQIMLDIIVQIMLLFHR